MESRYLQVRRQFLLDHQNADGGWGYFPGKQSWLEPTAYAALVLHGEPASRKAVDLVMQWQGPDGTFRPNGTVASPNWTTALGVTLASLNGRKAQAEKGVAALAEIHGSESDDWLAKVVAKLMPSVYLDRNPYLPGWPWRPNASAWIEPTAHSIAALRVASRHGMASAVEARVRERIDLGQRMILALRCKDGGWNYGSRSALNIDLPSYPETTGVAMLGLVGRPANEIARAVAYSRQLAASADLPPLAQAWLRVSLSLHGAPLAEPDPGGNEASADDILITAVEALGAPGGKASLL